MKTFLGTSRKQRVIPFARLLQEVSIAEKSETLSIRPSSKHLIHKLWLWEKKYSVPCWLYTLMIQANYKRRSNSAIEPASMHSPDLYSPAIAKFCIGSLHLFETPQETFTLTTSRQVLLLANKLLEDQEDLGQMISLDLSWICFVGHLFARSRKISTLSIHGSTLTWQKKTKTHASLSPSPSPLCLLLSFPTSTQQNKPLVNEFFFVDLQICHFFLSFSNKEERKRIDHRHSSFATFHSKKLETHTLDYPTFHLQTVSWNTF